MWKKESYLSCDYSPFAWENSTARFLFNLAIELTQLRAKSSVQQMEELSEPLLPHRNSVTTASEHHGIATQPDSTAASDDGKPPSEDERVPLLALRAASLLIEDALYGRKERHKMDSARLRLYWLYTRPVTAYIWKSFVLLDLFIAFFEYPYTLEPVAHWITPIIEGVCMAVLCLELYVRVNLSVRRRRFLFDKKQITQALAILATVIDIVVSAAVDSKLRVTRFLRPWFLFYAFRVLRTTVHTARKMIVQAFDVLLLAALALVLFGISSTIIFADSEEGTTYFSSYWASWYQYFVMFTMGSFPEVFIPAVEQFWGYIFLFVSFVLCVPWFLMAIVLASVYDLYKDEFKSEVALQLYAQHQNLSAAWQLLGCGQKEVLRPHTWRQLMSCLRPGLDRETVNFMFRLLDKNDDGYIIYSEFLRIVDLLDLNIKKLDHTSTLLERMFPRIYNSFLSRVLIKFTLHWATSLVLDIVLCLLLLSVVIQFQVHLVEDPNDAPLNDPVEIIMLSLLLVEALLKIYALGILSYIKNAWHKFDIVQLIFMFFALLFTAEELPTWARPLQVVYLGQITRLFRLLSRNAGLRTKLQNMVSIIPALKPFIMLQISVYYIFAQLGMQLFEGRIIEGDATEENVHRLLNFDSFGNSLLVLFSLNLMNNWEVTADAFADVTNKGALIFFITFQIIGSIIVQNLMVAFVLEAYQKQTDVDKAQDPIREKYLLMNQEFLSDGKPMWEAETRRSTRQIIRQILLEEIIDEEERFVWLGYLKKSAGKDKKSSSSLDHADSILFTEPLPGVVAREEESDGSWRLSAPSREAGDGTGFKERRMMVGLSRLQREADDEVTGERKKEEGGEEEEEEREKEDEPMTMAGDTVLESVGIKVERRRAALADRLLSIRKRKWHGTLRAKMKASMNQSRLILGDEQEAEFFHPKIELDAGRQSLQIYWNRSDLRRSGERNEKHQPPSD